VIVAFGSGSAGLMVPAGSGWVGVIDASVVI